MCRRANLTCLDRMASPKCPPLVNYLIVAIATLMIAYAGMLYFRTAPPAVSASASRREGFEDLMAMEAKGAGNPCQQNSDCVSNFCAVVDDRRKTCY